MTLSALEAEIAAMLVEAGLDADDIGLVLQGFSERLREGGVPVARTAIGSDLLHPVIDSRGYRWHPEGGVEREEFIRGNNWNEDSWIRSPFFQLLQTDEDELRRRLDDGYIADEFPLLDRLRDEGFTDYIAFAVGFGPATRIGGQQGIMASMAMDRPGGFRDDEIAMLRRLVRLFAVTFRGIEAVTTTRVLTATYLGVEPAARVLSGAIARGVAEPVDAILWYSDLQGFTRIADTVPRDELLALLNDYADVLVTTIRRHGGEVLKFIGDGILAKFPRGGEGGSCTDALDAAEAAMSEVRELNRRRDATGQPITDINVALHVGEVLYGNIGSRDRLDFTVVGPAVNEVSRIEALCRSLDQQVLISSAFARAAGDAADRLVSLGRFALRGVRRPEELFTLDRTAAAVAA